MKLLFALAIVVGFSQSAKAGFMVEPYLGMLVNSTGTTNDCSSNCDDEITGNAIGAKIGYKQLGFSFGLDYQMTTGTSTNEASGSSEFDLSISEYGLHVGYDFPILFRVYATYWLNSDYNISSGSNEYTLNKASGYTLGVGYSVLPMVALNLELKNVDYSELDYDVNGSSGTGAETDYSVNFMTLKLSIPFSI